MARQHGEGDIKKDGVIHSLDGIEFDDDGHLFPDAIVQFGEAEEL